MSNSVSDFRNLIIWILFRVKSLLLFTYFLFDEETDLTKHVKLIVWRNKSYLGAFLLQAWLLFVLKHILQHTFLPKDLSGLNLINCFLLHLVFLTVLRLLCWR